MGWQLTALFNLVTTICYLLISATILQGLRRTHQLRSNPLALATAAIFLSCAAHHAHHALHLLLPLGDSRADLAVMRSAFGEWHSWLLDAVGAVVALTYLGLRRSYGALLNTPAMFEDAVRVEAEGRLRELAYTDALTGCGNRAALELMSRRSDTQEQQELTVLYLDLDGFKAVNDRYGHEVGDRLLTEVGRGLREGLPDAEVFRLGGDEFAVVATGACPQLVEQCRGLVSRPVPLREGTLRPSASVGQASGSAQVEQLLREADMHMYMDKRRSRGSEPLLQPRVKGPFASRAARQPWSTEPVSRRAEPRPATPGAAASRRRRR